MPPWTPAVFPGRPSSWSSAFMAGRGGTSSWCRTQTARTRASPRGQSSFRLRARWLGSAPPKSLAGSWTN
eukprot:7480251-Prorocentrum_lima.AAC.1